MGAHFINLGRSVDGEFDPTEPEILLYVRDDSRDGSWWARPLFSQPSK